MLQKYVERMSEGEPCKIQGQCSLQLDLQPAAQPHPSGSFNLPENVECSKCMLRDVWKPHPI